MGWIRCMGGNGDTPLEFTETLIAEDTQYSGSLNFSESIENYDLIRIVFVNHSASDRRTDFLCTPALLKAVMSVIFSNCRFNEIGTDQYACYSFTNGNILTWSRPWARNCFIYQVYGVTANKTVTETVLLSSSSAYTGDVSGTDLFDYDFISIVTNTNNGMQLSQGIVTGKSCPKNSVIKFAYYPYGTRTEGTLTNTKINVSNCSYISGVKFT